jgi:hypothetical protein
MNSMKRTTLALLCCAACVAGLPSLAFGQQHQFPPGRYSSLPVTRIAPEDSAAAQFSAITGPTQLPTFTYNLLAYDGNLYSGSIVGRNPLNRGKTTTTVPTQIIPLVITIDDTAGGTGIVTYDPTAADPCVPGGLTDVNVITGSPIFTNNAWTMNGVNIGTTQYIDAFQRAQFWGQVQGTPYHLILGPSTLGSVALTFRTSGGAGSSGPGTNYFGPCGRVGVVNMMDLDVAIQNLLMHVLPPTTNVSTFPIFETQNVVSANPGHMDTPGTCCILGYHSGFFVGTNVQIYSPFDLDSAGAFGSGFTTALSHEMAEAINNPQVFQANGNLTPIWGNIGQTVGQCQNNFEVGDPLSEGFGTPTTPFTVVGSNGLTYNTQELAFYSWFFGSNSLGAGAGGKFSNNGTFGGHAIICPPGGTN